MAWFPGWDAVFAEREWGKYPGEELIRFIARNFYNAQNRAEIKLFELGSGTGANIWYLAREGFSVYGLDGSEIAINRARSRLADEELDADLRVGDAMDLPYEEHTFDAVIDVECISANRLSDARNIVAEAYRVLKPGGLFYSKTFATGMSGMETAEALSDESHTYVFMPDSPLNDKRYGVIRLMDENEVHDIYGIFSDLAIDWIERSDANRHSLIREWVVTGRKPM